MCAELSVCYMLKKHKLYLVGSVKGILQQVGKYTYSLSCHTFTVHGVAVSLLQGFDLKQISVELFLYSMETVDFSRV